jgi:hypothetical protein
MPPPLRLRWRVLTVAAGLTVWSPARGQGFAAAKAPADCLPADDCLCLVGADVDAVTGAMLDYERCQARLDAVMPVVEFGVTPAPPRAWWDHPGFLAAGGAAAGLIVGVLASRSSR